MLEEAQAPTVRSGARSMSLMFIVPTWKAARSSKLRATSRSFEDLAAFQVGTMNISDMERAPERTVGAWASSNMFRLLGQPPFLAPTLLAEVDRPGAPAV